MPPAVGACPNPYFPLEEGLKLTYRAGSSELTISTREVTSTPEGLKGLVAVDLKGRSGQTEAFCTSEGVRTGLGGLEGTLLSASGMKVEVVSAEGMAVPPSASMVPGATWKNSLSVNLTTARASRPGAQGRSIESFIWFAPGVGIVKVATGNSTDLELLKVERPAAVQKAAAPVKKGSKRL